MPPGLVESQELPEPIFTPSTKAEQGAHDRNTLQTEVRFRREIEGFVFINVILIIVQRHSY